MSDEPVAVVVWEDPPEHRRGVGRPSVWAERLSPLISRPGVWARVREHAFLPSAHTEASTLRRRRRPLPDGRWEFRSGTAPDGKHCVWARYLGPEDES